MIVWVDIETTGLDPHRETMLEIGMVITDDRLVRIDHRDFVIAPYDRDAIKKMEPAVREMHTKNGLLDEVKSRIAVDRATVEKELIEFMNGVLGSERPPMAGSSVHFDRSFLRVHMPLLEARFHYRNIDISTVKELAKRWKPIVVSDRPTPLARHRVYPDLLDTIGEAAYYKRFFF